MSEPTPELPAPEPGPSLADALAAAGGADALQRLALLRADQHRRWRRGERLLVEAYLQSVPALRADAETLLDLIYSEVLLRAEAGESPQVEEYVRRFPAHEAALRLQFELHRAVASDSSWTAGAEAAGTREITPGTQVADEKARQAARTRSADGVSAAVQVPGYEVLEVLGRGGMGVVYKARHLALNRIVALKMVLSGGHAGQAELARFRAEAAALARLQHPHIVQIFEVGEQEGRPYFALEHLEGGGLSAKLNGTPWEARQAAALVETLARAVHAAHERRVVHRDLKPANVLLTADGTPKITDFGLAKKLDADDGLSRTGQVVGTPSYMPPEQAAGKTKEVGPAADTYALGAILYELLTGRPPFKGPTSLDTLHQVLTDEPAPPRRLNSRAPRDLETVCLKCLEKQPGRRYASALELAEDLRRFQAGQPVRARPVGPLERGVKWARAHAALVAVASAAAAAVLISATTAFVLTAQSRDDAIRSRNDAVALADEKQKLADANAALAEKEHNARQDLQAALRRAEDETDKADEVTDFLVGTFHASDPLGIDAASFSIPKATGEALTAQAVLERGEKTCRTELQDRPAVQAKVMDAIGAVYLSEGKFKDAQRLLEDARAIRERTPDINPLDTAASKYHLGRLAHYLGEYDKAETLYREALAIRRERLSPHDPAVTDALLNLAWLLAEKEETEEAEKTFRDVIALRRQEPGGDDRRDVAIAKFGLAAFLVDQNDPRTWLEAAALADGAVRTFDALEGNKNLGDAVGLFQTALVRRALNPWLGEQKLRECLAQARAGLGDRSVFVGLVLHELAFTLASEGKDDEAEKDYQECLDIVRDKVGLAHPKAIVLIGNYATLLDRRGKRPQAEKLFQELLDAQQARFGEKHFFVANVLTAYADFEAQHDEEQCERMLGRAVKIYRDSGGPRRRYFTLALAHLGDLCLRRNRNVEAETIYREALEPTRQRFGAASEQTAYVADGLAAAMLRQGHATEEVEKLLRTAVDNYEQSPGKKPFDFITSLDDLGQYYRAVGRPAEAADAARKRRRERPADAEQLFDVACDLARCVPLVGDGATQLSADQQAERTKYAEEAVETLEQAVKSGFKDEAKLREAEEQTLAPLRDRADFQDLVKRFEGNVHAVKGP